MVSLSATMAAKSTYPEIIAALGDDADFAGTVAAELAGKASVPVVSRLTAAATRTLATYAGTGLSVPVAAGKAYRITASGQYRTAALTTGIGFRLGGTATATGVRYQTIIHGLSLTSLTAQAQSALGVTAPFSTAVAVANTDYPWSIDGMIRVNAAGTVTVDFATEVANSTATVQPDAYLMLEEVP